MNFKNLFLFVIYDYKKNEKNDLDILDINKNPTLSSID